MDNLEAHMHSYEHLEVGIESLNEAQAGVHCGDKVGLVQENKELGGFKNHLE
jgi:hypothetical protein